MEAVKTRRRAGHTRSVYSAGLVSKVPDRMVPTLVHVSSVLAGSCIEIGNFAFRQ